MDSKTAELNSDAHSHASGSDQVDEKAVEHHTPAFVPPDGGLKAWLCVLGGACCLFCSFGFLSACGIFQLYYQEELLAGKKNTSQISWITTIAFFLMYFMGPVFGVLADKKGPTVVLLPTSILIVFAICMLSLSTEYYQIMLSEGVAFGIGAGAMFLSPLVCVGRWFTTKRGLATGLVAAGSGLGGVIFPLMIPRLIEKHGFAASVRWTALLMGILLGIAVLTVKAPTTAGGAPSHGQETKDWYKDFRRAPWILWFMGTFLIMWGFFAPFDYLPLFASVHDHASQNMSDNINAILSACSVIGRIVPGYLGDKFGIFNVMTGVALLSGIIVLVFWLPLQYHGSIAATVVFGGVFGFISGGFVSLLAPCVITLSKGGLGDLGKKLGVFFVILAFAALSGLPIQGAIKDGAAANDFSGLIAFSGAVQFCGAMLLTGARVALAREAKMEMATH